MKPVYKVQVLVQQNLELSGVSVVAASGVDSRSDGVADGADLDGVGAAALEADKLLMVGFQTPSDPSS